MSIKVARGRPGDDISVPMLLWCNCTGYTQPSSYDRDGTRIPSIQQSLDPEGRFGFVKYTHLARLSIRQIMCQEAGGRFLEIATIIENYWQFLRGKQPAVCAMIVKVLITKYTAWNFWTDFDFLDTPKYIFWFYQNLLLAGPCTKSNW